MNEDPLFLDDYLSGNFFDFPMEDLEANDCGIDDLNNLNFQSLEPPPWPPFLSGLADEVTESNSISWNRAPQVKPQLTSTNTSSPRNFSLCNNSSDSQDLRLMHTSSPVSVLESSSSCSAEKPAIINPKLVFAVKRRRSNRRRPAIVNPLFVFPFVSSTSSTSEDYHPSTASQSGSEIHLAEKPAKKKQKRKKNLMMLSGSRVTKKPYIQQNGAPQKCMHCEVTETPQWREGPMGPKTLCNACGVRYRSGRLLPEYRPAASPTFVPSLHSNSHKKIMEMRDKGRQ